MISLAAAIRRAGDYALLPPRYLSRYLPCARFEGSCLCDFTFCLRRMTGHDKLACRTERLF